MCHSEAPYQKEGNGNIHTVLRIRHRSVINIRNISSKEELHVFVEGDIPVLQGRLVALTIAWALLGPR